MSEQRTLIDLRPAAARLTELLLGITDEQLAGPTPCPPHTLGDLLDHVGGLAVAFTWAATKAAATAGSPGQTFDHSRLGDDWRARISGDLETLADAWQDPAAWTGMTRAGGIDLPGEVAGAVALDELVMHGWDVARASGQAFDCDPATLKVVGGFVAQFSSVGMEAQRKGLFGPVVDVPASAPRLEQVLGLAGRDPAWSP